MTAHAPSRAPQDTSRGRIVDEIVALVPQVRRRFQTPFALHLESEFGSATTHQLEALHLLSLMRADADHGPGATMNELARGQGCALSTATALVDRLLKHGLAERAADPEDRRVVRIRPSAKGRALLSRFAEVKRSVALSALEVLSDDELTTLAALMRRVAADVVPVRPEEVRP